MLFGNDRVHQNCQSAVQNNQIRGAKMETLAWLEQNISVRISLVAPVEETPYMTLLT